MEVPSFPSGQEIICCCKGTPGCTQALVSQRDHPPACSSKHIRVPCTLSLSCSHSLAWIIEQVGGGDVSQEFLLNCWAASPDSPPATLCLLCSNSSRRSTLDLPNAPGLFHTNCAQFVGISTTCCMQALVWVWNVARPSWQTQMHFWMRGTEGKMRLWLLPESHNSNRNGRRPPRAFLYE